jgi:hypothetical protein
VLLLQMRLQAYLLLRAAFGDACLLLLHCCCQGAGPCAAAAVAAVDWVVQQV